LVEVCRKLLPTRIRTRIRDVDTSFGELVVDRLALVRGADEGHLTPAAGNQLNGCFDDPIIVPFSKHDPTANGRSSGLEPFKKAHNSSPAAIVTQEASPRPGS
jgi:hypothetical protein